MAGRNRPSEGMVKLLVVDDHAMVRTGISVLLQLAEPGAEVLEAGGSAEALEIVRSDDELDAVFLDLAMPGMDGLTALRAISDAQPGLPVIVLTASEDPESAHQAFAAGALGYVPKSATSDTLLAALRLVLQGEIFVPSLMVRARAPRNESSALTARQRELLRHLDEGLSNKAAAQRMGISEKTVKGHVTGLLRALAAGDRGDAVRAARVIGIL